MKITCLLLASVLLLCACGQKGPLYLPKDKPQKVRKIP
ncbi:LPS translocon maturation chaperone LptM [Legionella geestiana]|nr:lipoprotein [Legionella geestiana]QBS13033.1 lipopeptide [Legionella geestiana]QDQ39289.1 lipoprotein [Legionella geestiana]